MKEQIREGRVLVDFYADWCGPCKMLARELTKFEQEQDAVKVVKVNVDDEENAELASVFGVRSIPAIFYLEDGEVINKHIGTATVQQLKNLTNT